MQNHDQVRFFKVRNTFAFRFVRTLCEGCIVLLLLESPSLCQESIVSKPTGYYRELRAICIGIDKNPNCKFLPELPSTLVDAASVAEELNSFGFKTSLLIGNRATKTGIERAIRDLYSPSSTSTINEDDAVVIYYSGHGLLKKTATGEDRWYLIPYDAQLADSDASIDDFDDYCIDADHIRGKWMQNIPARHIMIVIESCYSGGICQSPQKPVIDKISDALKDRSREILTAADAKSESYSYPESTDGVSLYTGALIETLEDMKKHAINLYEGRPVKGVFTASQLAYQLCNNVSLLKQKPQYERLIGEGSFVFISKDAQMDSQEIREYDWELPDGSKYRLCCVPRGTFTKGTSYRMREKIKKLFSKLEKPPTNDEFRYEFPQSQESLDEFWMGKTEVTVGQFGAFIEDTPYTTSAEHERNATIYSPTGDIRLNSSWKNPFPEGKFKQTPEHPVVCISHKDAERFGVWAGLQLPTEDQWEKAARSSDERLYPWGDEIPNGGTRANLTGTVKTYGMGDEKRIGIDVYEYTAPVGMFANRMSPYGCMDMAGNISEWCRDEWVDPEKKRARALDPEAPEEKRWPRKGGSWIDDAFHARCAYVATSTEDWGRLNYVGFRLCATSEQIEARKEEACKRQEKSLGGGQARENREGAETTK